MSMDDIIDATDVFCDVAILFNVSMNSGSKVILVWWPDNDTDNFFIL